MFLTQWSFEEVQCAKNNTNCITLVGCEFDRTACQCQSHLSKSGLKYCCDWSPSLYMLCFHHDQIGWSGLHYIIINHDSVTRLYQGHCLDFNKCDKVPLLDFALFKCFNKDTTAKMLNTDYREALHTHWAVSAVTEQCPAYIALMVISGLFTCWLYQSVLIFTTTQRWIYFATTNAELNLTLHQRRWLYGEYIQVTVNYTIRFLCYSFIGRETKYPRHRNMSIDRYKLISFILGSQLIRNDISWPGSQRRPKTQ